MVTIVRTEEFAAWLRGLRDRRAISKVISQVNRMARGNMGDAKAVGEGVSETRIHYGPGYRLYFLVKTERIVLLYGGDKSTQQRDIATAKQLARGIPP
ncbi:MAG: type II toxin-antitoxin system RelE/ParE family toxin [Alphaproteobacteria bacterium]|nr:type II toxin-antitoxin system RelE/ParE family toxin [Alphaproteobacteria bacterium]